VNPPAVRTWYWDSKKSEICVKRQCNKPAVRSLDLASDRVLAVLHFSAMAIRLRLFSLWYGSNWQEPKNSTDENPAALS